VLTTSVASLSDGFRLLILTTVIPLVLVFLVGQSLRWQRQRRL
jgi:hypothetical protein